MNDIEKKEKLEKLRKLARKLGICTACFCGETIKGRGHNVPFLIL